jgi:spore germination protein YaaH
MCYDYFYAPTGAVGPTSTRPWARDGMLGWLQFVPREKLVMGIPGYGNDIDLTGNRSTQSWREKPPVPEEAIVRKGYLPYECLNWYLYREGESLRLLYAGDAQSIRGHLETADELDIPAVSFWVANNLSPQSWNMIREWLNKKR